METVAILLETKADLLGDTASRQYHAKEKHTKDRQIGKELHGVKIKHGTSECPMNNDIINVLVLRVVQFGLWVPVRRKDPETK